MKKNGIKEKIATNVGAIIYILAGGCIGVISGKMMSTYENSFIMLAILLTFLASLLVNIIIHESGHLLFGVLTGYKFLSFRIGNIMLLKKDGKYSIKKFSIAGTGGQCLLCPPEIEDGKIPYVFYNLGGIIMNIVSAAIGYWIYLCIKPGIAAELLLMFVVISISMALSNGIPLKNEQIANDGYNAISLGKEKAALRAFWLQLKINAELANDVMLKDIPVEWFRMPSDKELKNSMIAVEGVFYCNYLMANCKFAETEEAINSLLSKDTAIVGVHRGILVSDLIYCMISRREEKSKIDDILTEEQRKFMKTMATYPSVIRTWYAYNKCVLNDEKKAEDSYKEFEKVAATYPYPSDIENERILIEKVNTNWK